MLLGGIVDTQKPVDLEKYHYIILSSKSSNIYLESLRRKKKIYKSEFIQKCYEDKRIVEDVKDFIVK